MVVDRLTLKSLSLEEGVRLSCENKANLNPGTNMTILGPVVADLYDLDLRFSNNTWELAECLRDGGAAIVHIGGDREGHIDGRQYRRSLRTSQLHGGRTSRIRRRLLRTCAES